MSGSYKIVFSIIWFLFGLGSVCPKTSAAVRLDNLHSLRLEKAFPSENDETVLVFPTEFYIDENGTIYIIDQNQSKIHKFAPNGVHVGAIGRRGQGPGEFEMPHAFFYDENRLFIVDQGNRRVQILNSSGAYVSSFKLHRLIRNVVCIDNLLIGQEIFNKNENDDFRLLSIYDLQGSKKRSFGESVNRFIGIPGLPPDASQARLKVFNGRMFVLFQYYPLIREYALDGNLKKAYDINSREYKDLVPGNYDLKKILAAPDYVNLKYLFLAFDIDDSGFYICLYKPDIEVCHYDFNGRLVDKYVFRHQGDEDFYVQDIKLLKKDGVRKLFVLTYLPLPQIISFKLD